MTVGTVAEKPKRDWNMPHLANKFTCECCGTEKPYFEFSLVKGRRTRVCWTCAGDTPMSAIGDVFMAALAPGYRHSANKTDLKEIELLRDAISRGEWFDDADGHPDDWAWEVHCRQNGLRAYHEKRSHEE